VIENVWPYSGPSVENAPHEDEDVRVRTGGVAIFFEPSVTWAD
jgi:hypothetical protein